MQKLVYSCPLPITKANKGTWTKQLHLGLSQSGWDSWNISAKCNRVLYFSSLTFQLYRKNITDTVFYYTLSHRHSKGGGGGYSPPPPQLNCQGPSPPGVNLSACIKVHRAPRRFWKVMTYCNQERLYKFKKSVLTPTPNMYKPTLPLMTAKVSMFASYQK